MGCPGLFITGTDTGVGKTFVTCAIARTLADRGVNVGAYKPAVSGAERDPSGRTIWRDLEELWTATGAQFPRERIAPQRFEAPLAPPTAARAEGSQVDPGLLRGGAGWWKDRCDLLLVEGAGGLLSPIADHETVADLATDLGFPLIVVARLGLGTINHTLLTLEAARNRGLAVAGIVLNEAEPSASDPSINTNAADLAELTDVPVLEVVQFQPESQFKLSRTDWSKLVDVGDDS